MLVGELAPVVLVLVVLLNAFGKDSLPVFRGKIALAILNLATLVVPLLVKAAVAQSTVGVEDDVHPVVHGLGVDHSRVPALQELDAQTGELLVPWRNLEADDLLGHGLYLKAKVAGGLLVVVGREGDDELPLESKALDAVKGECSLMHHDGLPTFLCQGV